MRTLQPSYKTILTVSFPLMLGSATQQIIVLSDNVFLYHNSLADFGAIALVGVFYLLITSIGYGFSRGGQILIARRYGEESFTQLKLNFYALVFFQLILALFFFFILQFLADDLFRFFIKSPDYYERILDYIYPRSYGIFFSYIGLAFIALYTGIANTRFIIIDTMILAVTNLVLNYILIFGKLGFEPMGIKGAAYASTIAEIVAFIVFLVYMFSDRSLKEFKLLRRINFQFQVVKNMCLTSVPIVLQSMLGLGSWFVFFSFVEQKLGQEPLEISNLVRNVYLILSIPCWGFAAGINTLVSNMIGQKRPKAAISVINRAVLLCILTTMIFAIPICLFPEFFLYPLFGGTNGALLTSALPSLKILLPILVAFSTGAIYMNGVIGTGATPAALKIQFYATIVYLVFTWWATSYQPQDIAIVWLSEVFYWLVILFMTIFFLRSKKWVRLDL